MKRTHDGIAHTDRSDSHQPFSAHSTKCALFAFGVALVSISGCSFRPVPAKAAQFRRLGVPSSNQAVAQSFAGISDTSSGFVPSSFGSPTVATRDPGVAAQTADQAYQAPAVEEAKPEPAKEAQPENDLTKEGNTPLHRIAGLCPTVEKEVTEALTTTDRAERIQKYKALTSRCPSSSDLWLWLGRDQKDEGLITEALSSLEEAVRLDPQNIEAQSLRSEVAASARPGGQNTVPTE